MPNEEKPLEKYIKEITIALLLGIFGFFLKDYFLLAFFMYIVTLLLLEYFFKPSIPMSTITIMLGFILTFFVIFLSLLIPERIAYIVFLFLLSPLAFLYCVTTPERY